jgi:hypothetical protein
MIKILDHTYFDECMNFIILKNKISGTTPSSIETLKSSYYKYFQPNDTRFIIGYFEGNILISWISIGFFENKQYGKFWAITAIFTSRNANYFTFNRDDVGPLLKFSFEFAESKKYYQYFYSVAEKISHVYERQWKKNIYLTPGRYTLSEIETIPANTIPENSMYWKLMGSECKPDTIIIKKRMLKLKFCTN